MRRLVVPVLLASALVVGCVKHPERAKVATLAELHDVSPDVEEAQVDQGLEEAMESYRRFLKDTPETEMTPEAMRRLADLELEKQFGVLGADAKPQEVAAPEPTTAPAPGRHDMVAPEPAAARVPAQTNTPDPVAAISGLWESDQAFEERTTAEMGILPSGAEGTPGSSSPTVDDPSGPLEAIALYDKLLSEYPSYEQSDKVLYQKARAYDELGRTDEAMATMEQLIKANPGSVHYDEVQFRRGEYFFTRRKFADAENAYSTIITLGPGSEYYELALYKLGWTLYKREFYEEALHRYIGLLDYKVSVGYDFDQTHEEDDERRVADTFRVISLSFSNLGGPEAVEEYFSTFGNRSYEDRVYSNLGEHYLTKLRYEDAAKTYRAFVTLYPFHRTAPQFSMRIVETYTKGGFPKLVLEAKRDFATRYGLKADYWKHFTPEESPEVIAYLKTDLRDLATHYHAQYQDKEQEEEKPANYLEARRWYGEYLESFPSDAESPQINYRLADLLLENEDFGEAAKQYERTAYGYPAHPQSAAAGYAAVYAYREQLKVVSDAQRDAVKHDTVASSLRFADAFPDHEQAAAVLGAAADDMYEMKDYPGGVAAAQRVIDNYPGAEEAIRRSAWIVVAHGSFELADYPQAENAYTQVLVLTPEEDESHAGFVDNLAASIYRQGELARDAQDYRAAADHFLRIRTAAPTSTIRATAEYDAGAALIKLEAWTEAASVLETFRATYPEHELQLEATRLIAFAYQQNGDLRQAADEYDRVATQTDDPEMRSEALLVAGDLYEQSCTRDRALEIYQRYVDEFPAPLETAVETRFKIAEIYKAMNDDEQYHQELAEIVRVDAEAGPDRTARTRTLAARSALVLAEELYQQFIAVKLLQPFETSLQEKQERMDATIDAMSHLVDYEIADVTAAATFYMAETYFDFSHDLAESERPTDLEPAEMQEYEMALEEEAFPFEEKAIEVHEKNVEMLHAGVFNEWTQKSLDKLVDLMPGRYAKNEVSSGFLGAVDVYVYRSPSAPGPALGSVDTAPQADPVPTTELSPMTGDDGAEDDIPQ